MVEFRATVRLQFNKDFTLNDAIPLVDYFARLGISHLYASPLFTATPGSTHGYDIVDPTRINPELGGEPALERLVQTLRQHNMGLLLDIVPNHMAVGGDTNLWWQDVLEWGRDSPYARFFDIDWDTPDPFLNHRILVPFLGAPYGKVLAEGDISLHFDDIAGIFYVKHYEHRFPLHPASYATILNNTLDAGLEVLASEFKTLSGHISDRPAGKALCARLAQLSQSPGTASAIARCLSLFDPSVSGNTRRFHRLLEQQKYRLAYWRAAADSVNWRRFFDVNELAGIRVELPDVFEATHAKLFDLIKRGWVDGLRIDHVDGLANPRAYCSKLRRRVTSIVGAERADQFPVYVEKITAEGEQLPRSWGVDGTTGYDFMSDISLLQHSPSGEQPLRRLWADISERPDDFEQAVYEARHYVLRYSLAADVDRLAASLLSFARDDMYTRDFTYAAIHRVLNELIANFPVYRTYAGNSGRSDQDLRILGQVIRATRSVLPSSDWMVLDHLSLWLGGQSLRSIPAGRRRRKQARVLSRFQQLTSPAAAKAAEDTAGYRLGVLLSWYEVGAGHHFSAPIDNFHQRCLERQHDFPRSLLTTSTHDSKRGEDTRARLAVISERTRWFGNRLAQWRELASDMNAAADIYVTLSAADELILYQTVIGTWPLDLKIDDQQGIKHYLQRLLQWQQKALREAKLQTSWQSINDSYEQVSHNFLTRLLTADEGRKLRLSLYQAAAALAPAGALNSLTQCLLRMTVPGIPDLYQGAELWNFTMVDPDNRRPVNFTHRQHNLERGIASDDLLTNWKDGRIKQWLIQQVLNLRAHCPSLLPDAQYTPLEVTGTHANKVVAFVRQSGDSQILIVAPVRCAGLVGNTPIPQVSPERWEDTRVVLPPALHGRKTHSPLTDKTSPRFGRSVSLSRVLADFPVNVMVICPD